MSVLEPRAIRRATANSYPLCALSETSDPCSIDEKSDAVNSDTRREPVPAAAMGLVQLALLFFIKSAPVNRIETFSALDELFHGYWSGQFERVQIDQLRNVNNLHLPLDYADLLRASTQI